MGRYIRVDENNIVTSIRTGPDILTGEYAADKGEIGQKMIDLNTFVDVPVEEPKEPVELSMEDKINYIFYTLQGGVINVPTTNG